METLTIPIVFAKHIVIPTYSGKLQIDILEKIINNKTHYNCNNGYFNSLLMSCATRLSDLGTVTQIEQQSILKYKLIDSFTDESIDLYLRKEFGVPKLETDAEKIILRFLHLTSLQQYGEKGILTTEKDHNNILGYINIEAHGFTTRLGKLCASWVEEEKRWAGKFIQYQPLNGCCNIKDEFIFF